MRLPLVKKQILPTLLPLTVALSLSGCLSAENDQNRIEGSIPNVTGAYSAVLFHRKADRFRGETENISIIRAGEVVLNDIGNVYSANREVTGQPQKLYIIWTKPDTLQIYRDPKTHSHKENKHYDCLTGIFIQTTPFEIEYGDYANIHPAVSAETKPQAAVKKKTHGK